MDDLISQDDLDNLCPIATEDLDLYIQAHPVLGKNPEVTTYVLGQILHERLGSLPMKLEDKGAVIATIIRGLVEFNGDALAAHRALKSALFEQKDSTVH
jgi:hypothetical protein